MITHNEKFDVERPRVPSAGGRFVMSDHAMRRMYENGLSPEEIGLALRYGEPVYDRGARVYRVGKKHVRRTQKDDLRDIEGLQIVSSHDGVVITVYMNQDFRSPKTTHAPGASSGRRASDRPPQKHRGR
jgi:hypothetical protein